MKNFFTSNYKSIIAFAMVLALLAPIAVLAQDNLNITKNLQSTGLNVLGGSNTDLPTVIGNIVKILLGMIGVLFVVLIIYAGFLWMTAQGDQAKVDKAKKLIYEAIIGVVIIFLAYAITSFVLTSLLKIT